ncbi:MAG: GFA family protein [Candidatus Puniceispirillales bacterium]
MTDTKENAAQKAASRTTRGGCHCGRVQFTVTGELRDVLACHCRDCMKLAGNSVAATGALAENVEIRGDDLKWYRSSDWAERGFCQHCGGQMFYRIDGSPMISIMAGMLDDPTQLKFGGHIFLHDHPGHQPLEENPIDLHEQFTGQQRPGKG